MTSVYVLHSKFSSTCAHIIELINLLSEASNGRFSKDDAIILHKATRSFIGSRMLTKSLELRHTIKLIHELNNEIEAENKTIMDKINSPILSIPGINSRMGIMIIAEISDFSIFDSPNKILVYAGISLYTYQSG